jgi:hypothetical protein
VPKQCYATPINDKNKDSGVERVGVEMVRASCRGAKMGNEAGEAESDVQVACKSHGRARRKATPGVLAFKFVSILTPGLSFHVSRH